MEQNNENILSEETIGFIKKCYIHLNQARQGVWAFADLAEIVWNPKLQKKNKELYFSIIHDAVAYEIIKYEEILEMSELKNDFLAFYSKFVSKINTSHEYTNFLEDRITTLENRFGLVWKEQEEQLLKIVSEDEIILGVGKFKINKEYEFDGESEDKKKKFIKNKDDKQFTLTRKLGDSFLYFCKELNQLFLLYSVKSKINVYSFVENHYTKYYPILVKKGDNFGFGNVRDNLLIEGDNYFALQLLQFTHLGKIDVIYIDPPYNRGKRDFKYNDAYVGSDDGSRHSKWLSFMEKRINLAKNLLSDNGIIFISYDENEDGRIDLLGEKIFSPKNKIGKLVWHTRNPNLSIISQDHEYILAYSKNIEKVIPSYIQNKKYTNKTPTWDGVNADSRNYINPDNDHRGVWRNAGHTKTENKNPYEYSINVETGEISEHKKIEYPWYYNNKWSYAPKTIQKMWADNRIYHKKKQKNDNFIVEPFNVKKFKSEEASRSSLQSVIQKDFTTTSDGKKDFTILGFDEKDFEYPKPIKLIKYLIGTIYKKDAIILDFFAGSGTTGQAVIELNKEDGGNRKFILCTNNEDNICEKTTYSRLERINNPSQFNLNIERLEHGLSYFQIKHISDLDLENADDIGNFEYVKQINNIKFSATKTIEENEYIYITDTYSVFKKTNKDKQKEYCDFFEQSIKENITNLVFVSSDRSEYDYFRKVISDYISTLKENPLFEKIKYYQMSKNYMENMLSIINCEEEIDVEKYMVDEENQENGEQQ